MGRGADDLHTTSDVNIYNDHEFYQVLLSDFLQASGDQEGDDGEDGHDSETERRFLGGADLGLTQKYLDKKKRLAEEARQRKKDIDRKASKNRKIRYVVHDKLLNFLMPQQNLLAMEGRQALVGNLFGAKKMLAPIQESSTAGKKRRSKDVIKSKYDEDDDIALI